jgi:hypothetical protein
LSSTTAGAGQGDYGRPDAGSDPSAGTVTVAASFEFDGGQQVSGSAPSKPQCTWTAYGAPGTALPGEAEPAWAAQASAMNATLYTRECPAGAGPALSWVLVPNVAPEVRAQDLVAAAASRVTAQLPLPTLNMNPAPSVGGVVNIGLWLAVRDPGQVSITASAGPVWATVTARYDKTVWEFGNGDSAVCAGLGTPIVDLNTAAEGPCGYTYHWPSTPKFTGTDDLAYHAQATGNWAVSYVTSTGMSGSLPVVSRVTAFLYKVREFQTVGVAPNG